MCHHIGIFDPTNFTLFNPEQELRLGDLDFQFAPQILSFAVCLSKISLVVDMQSFEPQKLYCNSLKVHVLKSFQTPV